MSYAMPLTLCEALALLRDGSPRVIAGCTDFFPSQAPGARAQSLLDITAISDCRGISETADGWRIGAAVTWTDVVRAPLPPAFDALKLAAREVGSIQIQNRGTVVGNICNASPAADGVPPLLALNAQVEIASSDATRTVPLSAFIQGVRKVDLARDEMVVAVIVPKVSATAQSAFLKLGSRKHLVISIAMVAAVAEVQNGRLSDVRVAVGSCSAVAQRLPGLEARLIGCAVGDVATLDFAADDNLAPLTPISDVRGSAEYRMDVAAELCRRAVVQACGGGS
ncbi:xanthine dehydrogenase family protein subunit M [Roseobacter denitrificans]|uniref:Dehydrogenase, putative n=1 Tax=Roseobacter denitrificans (strain ATCC 33942 / OCh 114) TaxID=375451 RepID=Q16A29_ROSDO|nr:xanthine dehydrogenase family protein subunit M [Roseobacter denitrificans]ABG31164.1 dehydrogenase, putative [Roseobacter denitrificans OCh 114]AVL54225.1 xanthine dehydrogenase family protein subunit M [Roseobacter denitrificans]SFG32066.1 CO or xanthine dehydrogenase, FAD-binding subunit [Roseobacter denitrificans OCh 114]